MQPRPWVAHSSPQSHEHVLRPLNVRMTFRVMKAIASKRHIPTRMTCKSIGHLAQGYLRYLCYLKSKKPAHAPQASRQHLPPLGNCLACVEYVIFENECQVQNTLFNNLFPLWFCVHSYSGNLCICRKDYGHDRSG